MSTVPNRYLSPQEYLAQERLAEFRSEYFRGETFAMSGATWEHTLVKDNIAGEARQQLKGGPCRALTTDLRVLINATGLYTYPDIIVVCDEPQFEDDVRDTLLNPRAIVEVLSKSTENYDRGAKFDHYKQVLSIMEYVLVAQNRPYLERHVRQPDGTWLMTEFSDMNALFAFESVPVRIPLAEIYQGVEFPSAP